MPTEMDVRMTIANAWQPVVGDTQTGTKNFFLCGGSSLDAVKISMQISRSIGLTVKPRLLFENPVMSDYENAVLKLLTNSSAN
jgi:hypothetical protein